MYTLTDVLNSFVPSRSVFAPKSSQQKNVIDAHNI